MTAKKRTRLIGAAAVATLTLGYGAISVEATPLDPSEARCFGVAGASGAAALVNLTPLSAQGPGSGVLVSSDVQNPPNASNVNFNVGTLDPNVAVAPVGADGEVCYANSEHSAVELLADHMGTIGGGVYTPAVASGAPDRKLDTRNSQSVEPAARRCFAVAGNAGDAAIVNLTPLAAAGAGNGALVSSDVSGTPDVSNVNFGAGTLDPNVAVAPIGADGKVCFANSEHSSVDVIADHLGTVAKSGYTPATNSGAPDRKLDTRNSQSVEPSARRCFAVAGNAGDAAIVNLTPLSAQGPGSGLLISSDVTDVPAASNVNFGPGTLDPNVAIAPIGADGKVCFANSEHSAVDVIADHLGTVAKSAYTPATDSGAPDRKLDTREEEPPPPPPSGKTYQPGQYMVGSELPAGRYEMQIGGYCYWERLGGLSGEFDDIIANQIRGFSGRLIVDIASSDVAFEFDADCGTMTPYTGGSMSATIAPGGHVVGDHIQPGTYTTNAEEGCYWERVTSFGGTIGEILANDYIDTAGKQTVEVLPGDVGFVTEDECGTWQPA